MNRWAPRLVSMLGIVGLSLAMTYLVAIILAFVPGYERITFFLVGRSDLVLSYNFLLVLIPYGLLVVYLFARTHLGSWMLEQGWVDEARDYASTRTERGLMRGRQEALYHRLTLARVEAIDGDYDRAGAILMDRTNLVAARGRLRTRWVRWALEVALRRENAVEFESVWARVEKPKGPACAPLWACRAESFARKAEYEGVAEALANARYADPQCSRVAHAEAVAKLRMPDRGRHASMILGDLVSARDELVREVPFLEDEVEALSIFLAFLEGASDAGKLEFSSPDSRTRFVIAEIQDVIFLECDSKD